MTNLFPAPLMTFTWACCTSQVHSHNPQSVPAPVSPFKIGPGSGRVVLADVNRDGHLDLVTQHLRQQKVSVQLGDGDGHFAPDAQRSLALDFPPESLAVGDVNNDGLPDPAVGSKAGGKESIHIFLGSANRLIPALGSPLVVSETIRERYKPDLRFLDINEDGKLDLASKSGGPTEILFGDGRGGFSLGPALRTKAGLAGFGDVNGDGHHDVVSVNDADGDRHLVVVKFGDGQGSFTDPAVQAVTVPFRAGLQMRILTRARLAVRRRAWRFQCDRGRHQRGWETRHRGIQFSE